MWIGFTAAVFLAAAAWFRFRCVLDWPGGRDWSGVLEFGFPGIYLWSKKFPVASQKAGDVPALRVAAIASNGQAGFFRLPAWRRYRRRFRRALFRFATDAIALQALRRAGLRFLSRALRLLDVRVEGRLRHVNPATLGRWAGGWQVTHVFPGFRRVTLDFDFEDSKPPGRFRVRAGFSALRGLLFLILTAASLPWIMLLRRAWFGWRHAALDGWRAFAFARIQRWGRADAIS